MAEAWDTSLVSRVREDGPEYEYLIARARAADPVVVPAPVVSEVFHGYARVQSRLASFTTLMQWLELAVLRSGLVEVQALDLDGAIVAGELRARASELPPARRGDKRSRGERRVAWTTDLTIAAMAFVEGLPIVTRDRRDYELIAGLLADLAPSAFPLAVLAPSF